MSNLGAHNGDGIRYSLHLSAPKGGSAQMLRDPQGDWVGLADYQKLQAEVERLTKAGNAMCKAINADDSKSFLAVVRNWHTAKEGKTK